MTEEFGTLISLPLAEGATCSRPGSLPEMVHLTSPAIDVMTDLQLTRAVTTGPNVSIDDALAKMKYVGVRLLFVIGAEEAVIGVISADDILGERPVVLAEKQGLGHKAITVEMVMTPHNQITVMDMVSVNNARVSHIIATLHKLERQHGLVVQSGPGDRQTIRGIFSTSQISRQLGKDVPVDIPSAHSLAELVQGA